MLVNNTRKFVAGVIRCHDYSVVENLLVVSSVVLKQSHSGLCGAVEVREDVRSDVGGYQRVVGG